MKSILPCLIASEQGAFVYRRHISNNILLAQKIMHSLDGAPPSKSLMMLKVDMKKAFDKPHWPFMVQIMKQFGFHTNFIQWIQACVTASSFAILVNGSPII